ncbi:DUF4333 domain-containing protein [Streptomyces coeruleorubidus]|uniref:DUF4333 domain-containing protein n=1 Tax=Streptomyces coeruleorubidus TaxID=116188 RepID=UPI0036F519E5
MDEVSCPARLKAVAGATDTCTAWAGGGRVSIPVLVTRVEGDPATPRVTRKSERRHVPADVPVHRPGGGPARR